MPRNGSGIYSKPAGTTAVTLTPIDSTDYNATIDDLVQDANDARPITAGGTGATSAAAARTALGVDVTPPGTGGYLQYTSTTSITLAPASGGLLWINGVNYAIPASLTLSNSGLSNSTTYYVYAYMSGATMTLETSATGYTAASNGMPQKAGDATRTLVGMISTGGSGLFQVQGLGVVSYFNRRNLKRASTAAALTGSSGGTSYTEANALARAGFLLWADEAYTAMITGWGLNASAGSAFFSAVGLDITVVSEGIEQVYGTAGSKSTIAETYFGTATEGVHYITIFIKSDGVGLASYGALGSAVMIKG